VVHPSTWRHDELISELEVSGPLLRVTVQSREFPHADDHVYRGGNICGEVMIGENVTTINTNQRKEERGKRGTMEILLTN
jgi:hypothetical protein